MRCIRAADAARVTVGAIVLLLASGSVQAQTDLRGFYEPRLKTIPADLQSASSQQDFLALDLVGGFLDGAESKTQERPDVDPSVGTGWEAGVAVRFLRWLGVSGSVARTSREEIRLYHYLIGPRFTTPYSSDFGVRAFAHILGGRVYARHANAPSDSSPELVIGGGFDGLFFVRVQLDYVRVSLKGIPNNGERIFIGAVVPLCFRRCRDDLVDGIEVSSSRR